ncbi:DUF28-domain-containing protein [Basidiobolus meristosporus CBS 931.73]|uniref:DUF28-domain-containing protein n=1 Tax=Basidiobolus meristosporus CBS 931.73 TaxID=1314790 RepID=A0A1Y1YVM9_9FUNG|nr:DUF28-domain-containing protein [Basidiobolus meristosporus CBS 931.73]|eukprot:ORY02090.1 DUF28-domain-containing protein [Basidiobolus meristosporus CBS 931.73]
MNSLARISLVRNLGLYPVRVTPCLFQKRWAGHSKWAKIKRSKGEADRKRGEEFGKLGKELIAAIRANGPDPSSNLRLAAALARAKTINLPKENIDSAFKKAAAKESEAMEEITFEGIGPSGVAMIVETMTDSRNRTVKGIRHLFSKYGGSMSSVMYMFEKKGRIEFSASESGDSMDTMMDNAIDAGAEDIAESEEPETIEITCDFTSLNAVSKELATKYKYEIKLMEPTYVPTSTVEPPETDEDSEKLTRALDAFESFEDVTRIHTNLA